MADQDITGERIREARERANLTQEELSAQVGVSLRTVGSWERGEHLPKRFPARVRDFVREWGNETLPTVGLDGEPTLHAASDAQLIAEIAYRLNRTSPPAV